MGHLLTARPPPWTRQPFEHMLFHCTLTYSNCESVTLCFSESFEALSVGLQNAFWEMGGVPERHRSDSLTAAVNNLSQKREFQSRYRSLTDYYQVEAEKTNPRKANENENGDVESSHGHLKTVLDQALLLRGSRDFASREEYAQFLQQLIDRRNAGRLRTYCSSCSSIIACRTCSSIIGVKSLEGESL